MAAGNDAVKQSGRHGFWVSIGVFSILAALYVARLMLDMYLTQRFIIAWRVWLTDHLTGDWLDGQAYYRGRFIDDTIDNPDQRIQQDIDTFTAGSGDVTNKPSNGTRSTLLFGAVDAVVSVISFTAILWNLSGPLTVFGCHSPQGDVLDRHRHRAGRDHRRVLDRPPVDLAQLSQRESSTPRSAMRWCGCATPRRRWASTAASTPSASSCGSDSARSSTTTAATCAGRSASTAGTGRSARRS